MKIFFALHYSDIFFKSGLLTYKSEHDIITMNYKASFKTKKQRRITIMKKYLTVILALCMVLLCFVSCGNGNTNSGDVSDSGSNPNNEEEKYLDDQDFGGYAFTFLGTSKDPGVIVQESDIDKTSILDRAKIERDEEIKKRFNIVFEEKILSIEEHIASYVRSDSLKPTPSFDFGRVSGREDVSEFLLSHSVADVRDIPVMDLDKPWYIQQANEEYTIMDRQFFVSGMYPELVKSRPLLFNKTMLNDLNMDLPYSIILDGKWTFEEFKEYMSVGYSNLNETNNDVDALDRFGYAGHEHSITYFYQGLGGLSTVKAANGAVIPVIGDGDSDTLYTMLKEFMDSDAAWMNSSYFDVNDSSSSHSPFYNGRAMFCSWTAVISDYTDIDSFEYGLAIYPKLDTNQTQYYSPVQSANLYFFPKNSEDFVKLGTIYEALSEASYRITYPASLQEARERKLLVDDESVAVQKLVDQSLRFDILNNFDPVGGLSNNGFIWMCLQEEHLPSILALSWKDGWEITFESFFDGE